MNKDKEPLPDKKLVKLGRKWHSKFHMGLGYRICEDDYDLQALALTMINTMINIKQETRKEILEEVEKMINKFQNNIWTDERCFEGIKSKTCLPLDWIDNYLDILKQELKSLEEKEK
jgi:hypothetical protein